MSIDSPLEQAPLIQLQQTPIDNVLQIIDEGLVHLPTYRELYYRWERQQWKASEIDFQVDIQQWQATSEEDRTLQIYGLAAFFQGEASVTDTLSPYITAMPDEEMRLFLTTQQVDEARHTVFFSRFFQEVLGVDKGKMEDTLTEVRQYMNPELQYILIDSLKDTGERLRLEPSNLALLVEGVTLYHVIIEGTMALAGQRAILENYRQADIFPGFRGGFTAVARDESRHVVFGVKFLREMIQQDHDYAKVVQATVEKYATTAFKAIAPREETIPQLLAEQQDPWAAPRFAQDSLRKKLKVMGLSMALPDVPPLPVWEKL
jgi:ribonucleoside-diphosphate reductase beta chain